MVPMPGCSLARSRLNGETFSVVAAKKVWSDGVLARLVRPSTQVQRQSRHWLWVTGMLAGTGSGKHPRKASSAIWSPREDSNLRARFRKPVLYPLSYGG